MSKQLVSIEGNIGVGKSTFVNLLLNNISDSDVVSEPIDKWLNIKDSSGLNILKAFYDDKKRWSYTFQNLAYVTRMDSIESKIKTSESNLIFLDRSINTDMNVFAKMLYADELISELEYNIYKCWTEFYATHIRDTTNIKIIYLRCDIDIAVDRIKKRGRIEEESIGRDYLEKLHMYHEQWLMVGLSNVLVLDCNKDFENDIDYQTEIIEKVKLFINS
jgi:deoxyadenosine/deoxycytidine kinase